MLYWIPLWIIDWQNCMKVFVSELKQFEKGIFDSNIAWRFLWLKWSVGVADWNIAWRFFVLRQIWWYTDEILYVVFHSLCEWSIGKIAWGFLCLEIKQNNGLKCCMKIFMTCMKWGNSWLIHRMKIFWRKWGEQSVKQCMKMFLTKIVYDKNDISRRKLVWLVHLKSGFCL